MAIKKLKGRKAKAPAGINIHSGNTTTGSTNVVVSGVGGGTNMWSSGTWISSTDPAMAEPSDYESLEMNWVKVKESLGEIAYEKVVRDAIKKWLQYDNNDRIESLLKHEGFLDTKRENSLNNLLDDELDEDNI